MLGPLVASAARAARVLKASMLTMFSEISSKTFLAGRLVAVVAVGGVHMALI
jgi:hypothetical protein